MKNKKTVMLRKKFEGGDFYKEYHTLWDNLSRPGNFVSNEKSYFINLSFDNGYDVYVTFRDNDTSKIVVCLGFLDDELGYIHDINTKLVNNASEAKEAIYDFYVVSQKLISYDRNNYKDMMKYRDDNNLKAFLA